MGDKRAYGCLWTDFDLENAQPDSLDGVNHYLHLPLPLMGTRHRIYAKWESTDRLWVRETWDYSHWWQSYQAAGIGPFNYELPIYCYKADTDGTSKGWHPSIHMPKEAARIWLEVEGVGVEKLKDISEDDAKAEGVEKNPDGSWHDYLEPMTLWQDDAKVSYQSLWMHLNGPESWEQNPWVWKIQFKRVEK